MKQITLSLIYVMCFFQLSAQIDNSWYVLDGKYRTSNSSGIIYLNSGPTSKLEIDNIKKPSTNIPPIQGDDIFVIFSDGSYYNSRDHFEAKDRNGNVPWAFSNASVNDKIFLDANGSGNIIKYMYWTDKYTQDLPPPGLTASPYSNTSLSTNNINPSSFIETGRVSSINDIVPSKDYVLIVSLNDGNINNETRVNLRRYYNPELDTYSVATQNFFDTHSIFNGKFGYPFEPLYDLSIGEIIIPASLKQQYADKDHLFINLRPTPHLINTFLPGNSKSSTLRFAINTTINGTDDEILESVRLSHDPNHLYARCICDHNGNTYLYYEGDFQNDGNAVTPKDINFRVVFPNNFVEELNNGAEIKVRNLKFGGRKLNSSEYNTTLYNQTTAICNISSQFNGLAYDNNPDDGINPESVATFEICIGPLKNAVDVEKDEHLIEFGAVKFYINSKIEEQFYIIDDLKSETTFKEVKGRDVLTAGDGEITLIKQRTPVIEECEICGKADDDGLDPICTSFWCRIPLPKWLWIFAGILITAILAVAGGRIIIGNNRRKRKEDND